MAVILDAIKLNHDPASASRDALNIRRNATQPVPFPEWQRGVTTQARDSLAAYAIDETRGNVLTIQARLRRTDPQLTAVEVRAVQPISSPAPGLLEALLAPLAGTPAYEFYLRLYRYLWTLLTPHNVLGEVAPREVRFRADGTTDFETFELLNARLWTAGVGAHEITWEWQYRRGPGDLWSPFADTRHTIYTVLSTPKAPWQQRVSGPAVTQLPWTEVLDHACRWAAGARDPDIAAGLVTRAVFALGQGVMQYDCVDVDGFGVDFLGSPHYTWLDPFSLFECTLFLNRLRGGVGAGPFVNCTDCAAIVSTFANALGCDLSQSRMGYSFALNPFLAIGSRTWERACGNFGSFFMHEVAWTGACTSEHPVFDACLAVDVSGDPSVPPHIPVVPTLMAFGLPGQGQYRDRLAAAIPTGRLRCNPQPVTRKRRWVV